MKQDDKKRDEAFKTVADIVIYANEQRARAERAEWERDKLRAIIDELKGKLK